MSAEQAGQLVANTGEALALCHTAATSAGKSKRCWNTLETLEHLLPALEPGQVEALLRKPEYCSIRADLLRIRADTWFERECELAREWLESEDHSEMGNLFSDHIPREAYAEELSLLQAFQPQHFLIIGSGACPMSAVVIQEAFPTSTVVCLDRSKQACDLSVNLLAASGHHSVRVAHGDADDAIEIGDFDCIIMALTVGTDEAGKHRIIGNLKARADPDTILAARTAVDWGRVLYSSIDHPTIAARANHRPPCTPQQRSVVVPVRMRELEF